MTAGMKNKLQAETCIFLILSLITLMQDGGSPEGGGNAGAHRIVSHLLQMPERYVNLTYADKSQRVKRSGSLSDYLEVMALPTSRKHQCSFNQTDARPADSYLINR